MAQSKSKGVFNLKNIFDEMTLNQLRLKNRLFRSATWVALADDDGSEIAKGGVAAIITGLTTVSPHDAYLEGGVNFSDDKFIEQHKKFTEMIHSYDCKIFMQTAMVDSVFYVGEDFCVIAKINGDDFADGGLNIHDCIVACKIMEGF